MRVLNKKHWPIQITMTIVRTGDEPDPRDAWCKKHKCISFTHIYSDRKVFAFKNEEDLLAFKLTWK